MDLLLTFPSSHAALGAERALSGSGVAVELIPVPRQIRSDCGFCLLTDVGVPDTPDFERRLRALRACAPQGLWRVLETQPDPRSRKVKSYERLP